MVSRLESLTTGRNLRRKAFRSEVTIAINSLVTQGHNPSIYNIQSEIADTRRMKKESHFLSPSERSIRRVGEALIREQKVHKDYATIGYALVPNTLQSKSRSA